MKKIVILSDQICNIGGIVSLITLKANYWVAAMEYEVSIVTTEQNGRPPFYTLNDTIRLHDLAIDYKRDSSYFKPKNLLRVVKNYFRLNRLLHSIGPDIVIVANHIPVTFFFPLLRSKAKFVKEFHFSKYFRSKNKKTLFSRFESYLESKFDYLVVLNPEEREFYNSDNVIHIANPIDFSDHSEPPYQDREKIAMAAGRISEVKRFDKLIDLWEKFSRKNNEWKLEIYGEGEKKYVNSLRQRIKDLKLSDHIEIKKSTDKIKDTMRSYGLYLMTSSQECFPMVLLEAQSCGLPIIAYDCPTGPRNIITHDYDGILVDFDNETEFVDMLMKLTSNEELRIQLAKNGFISSKKYALAHIMSIWDNEIINK